MAATYKDVKSDLLAKIMRGDWGPGELVPNEVELAATYGCARATVNRAMRELADEGLIERRRKAGTRVRMTPIRQARFDIPVTRTEVAAKGAVYRYALVKRAVAPAPDWLRARLGLAGEARALHLVCMHYADGVPYEHEDRWISLDALPQAEEADFSDQAPTEWLLAAIPYSEVEISLSAEQADQRLTDYLPAPSATRSLPSSGRPGGKGRR